METRRGGQWREDWGQERRKRNGTSLADGSDDEDDHLSMPWKAGRPKGGGEMETEEEERRREELLASEKSGKDKEGRT